MNSYTQSIASGRAALTLVSCLALLAFGGHARSESDERFDVQELIKESGEGDAAAQTALGEMYLYGAESVGQDRDEGLRLLRLAADQPEFDSWRRK